MRFGSIPLLLSCFQLGKAPGPFTRTSSELLWQCTIALQWGTPRPDRCYDCYTESVSMSLEQLKAFLAKVNSDISLQEKLKSAENSDVVVAIAAEEGFSITTSNLEEAELTEQELEGLAGGVVHTNTIGKHCCLETAIKNCPKK